MTYVWIAILALAVLSGVLIPVNQGRWFKRVDGRWHR